MPIWASFSTTWWNNYYIFALVSLYTSSPACKQARWLEREFSMVLQKMLASHHRVCSISCNTQLAFTSRSWLKWTINGLFRHVNYSSNLLSPNHPPLWTRISERMSCEESIIFFANFAKSPVSYWSKQRASGDKLRAAIDVGRKQYQPKQLKSCHFPCFL